MATDLARVVPSGAPARTAVLVGAAGLAVAAGVVRAGQPTVPVTTAMAAQPSASSVREAAALLAARTAYEQAAYDRESRSLTRPSQPSTQHATKVPVQSAAQQVGGATVESVPLPTPREVAMALLPSYGWDSAQFSCLDAIWSRESGWNPHAENYSSGAYGIPQALPGSKMAAFGSDWATNPETQIKWGLWYIRASYGSPCGAWYFWESHSWY